MDLWKYITFTREPELILTNVQSTKLSGIKDKPVEVSQSIENEIKNLLVKPVKKDGKSKKSKQKSKHKSKKRKNNIRKRSLKSRWKK